MKNFLKKYWPVIGIALLIALILYIWYRAFFAYLGEHSYYDSILSSGQNWRVVISAFLSVSLFPVLYLFAARDIKIKNLILWTWIWAAIFWLINCHIKWDVLWAWNLIVLFNTLLLFSLWIYLILGFSAVGSWIQRNVLKFQQQRWQEMLLSFGLWMIGFIIIVQILLWLWVLYWIVSWVLFLWLGFMIRYERKWLKQRWDIIIWIFDNMKNWVKNIQFRNRIWMWYIMMLILSVVSLSYIYIWIQNSFIPYSTAWDANHEYMYIPKILAENSGVYWWNTVWNTMPWLWHQFLTFIFSLTGCTDWWFWLSPDNLAVSMNFLSAVFVLIFWIAIVFQIFSLVSKKKSDSDDIKLEKWKKNLVVNEKWGNWVWISVWWSILLLWLTSGMWAFLVIVDNKTDLWVMALSLLALLAWLIFLQNRKDSDNKNDILKYLIITWLFFWFATLAKVTAFVDLVLFWLLLIWLWFSSLTTLWIGIITMWVVRKFNILTSSVILTETDATWLMIVWGAITVVWLMIHLSRSSSRKEFWKNLEHLLVLWFTFLISLIVLKLPRVTMGQFKTNTYSIWNSLRWTFLSMNIADTNDNKNNFLAQNLVVEENDSDLVLDSEDVDSIKSQNAIDSSVIEWKSQKTFNQCSSVGNVYSDDELEENLQTLVGWQWGEDFWRYIWFWWKEFTKETIKDVDGEEKIEKNWIYWLLKLIRPTRETCYWLNHDAKVLCNNADVINSFKIDDLRAIYENGIEDQDSEAWLLLKTAIDSYNEARSSGKIWFVNSNLPGVFYDEIVNLRQYYQSHSILSDEDSVNIPYRFIVPLNISFNWSLQNLSSYYTDIGFIWVVVYVLLIIALPYAIVKKDKLLTAISLTTLIWWWIWWIIGSAILWYGTVLISWTMITLALFLARLLSKEREDHPKILLLALMIVLMLICSVQILLNFLRISSQWANSIFVRYKWNVGQQQIVNENLQGEDKLKYWYWWKNVFDLQFWQYNPIINALADRKNEDWVIIAWTYSQYFLWNQWNIKSDGMLSEFWRKTSDGDLCKTYRRLKNDNTRYLIIDPNIWTVTMWEWNETLFYRFFGKLNQDKSKIEMDWTIITLVRLARAGYIKLLSTNNIWSKYALVVDDEMVRQYFGQNLTDEDLILVRAKMAVLQYFWDANYIFERILNMFMTRIVYDMQWWIEDIANIYGFTVDSGKIMNVAGKYINWQSISWEIESLTNEERMVLVNFINVYLAYKKWDSDSAYAMAQNLLVSSVSGWSQVIALELN